MLDIGATGAFADEQVAAQDNVGITAARRVGSYCDDMYITCSPTGGSFRTSTSSGYWTRWFSDENAAVFCSPDGSSNNMNYYVCNVAP